MILQGDCLKLLKTLEPNSIDSIVTDPPYGLEFMGKEWDKLGNYGAYKSNKPKELKSGQSFSKRIGRVSFNSSQNKKCRKCGHWEYSGTPCKCEEPDFPNIKLSQSESMQKFHHDWAVECLRVLKPGGHLLSFAGTRTYHRTTAGIEDAGFEIRDMIAWVYGSGFPKSLNIGKKVKKWEGWGTALKPALEPICVARKPLSEKTVATNVLRWGTGGINIDGSRIGLADGDDTKRTKGGHKTSYIGGHIEKNYGIENQANRDLGRFPANFIHDGSEEVERLFPNTTKAGNRKNTKSDTGIWGNSKETDILHKIKGDSGGSASRFFYCAKASKSERGEGNNHPTVKPIKLMRYLVKLVTPPKGTVLDPFTGSGTTGIACKLEGFEFIGMEREQEYIDIANARIEDVTAQQKLI